MGRLTLDEELFLLSRDAEKGRDRSTYGIDAPLAGAVLIELAEAGAILVEDGRVVARPGVAPPRAHHRAAVELIAADVKRRKLDWVGRLPGRLGLQERDGHGRRLVLSGPARQPTGLSGSCPSDMSLWRHGA